jgi:HD-GYP domain-containing protein (c-di-GMP phosphodiesterase class II)
LCADFNRQISVQEDRRKVSFVEQIQSVYNTKIESDSFATLVRTLEEKLPHEIQCWNFDQGWCPFTLPHQLPESNELMPGTVRLLSRAEMESLPYSVSVGGGDHLLVVPFKSLSSHLFAATTMIRTSEPQIYVRLARLSLEIVGYKQQIDDLLVENDGFVRQVTEDFEELSFLRQIARDLEVSAAIDNAESLAQKMFKLLNYSIKAESISLVPAPDETGSRISSQLKLATMGELKLSEAELLKLVQDQQSSNNMQPRIVNHFESDNVAWRSVHSFIICPLVKSENILGWLVAINRTTSTPTNQADKAWREFNPEFGSSEATLLSAASAMLATHISNSDLFYRNKRLLANVVRALVSAIEAKDAYTCGHSERVALYGQCLAKRLGYSDDDLQRLYLSGLLHDIGKIGISDAVLTKPGKLTDEEFDEIKRHPRQGWHILQGLEELESIMPGVVFHHERIDGKGYPDGLAGEEIPIDGRLLAVADAFDAMTSDRPYRKGMSIEKAFSILLDGAGTQWDPELVQAFVGGIDEIKAVRDQNLTTHPMLVAK